MMAPANTKQLIGDESFIGSTTSLHSVFPVGSNATVAAGSVITKDVPDGDAWCRKIETKLTKKTGLRKRINHRVEL